MLFNSCVETAKPADHQILHLYTDFPESFNNTFFRNFGRKNRIQVFVHNHSKEEIIARIKDKKYESEMDAVILRNALDIVRLNNLGAIQAPKDDADFYQALLHDPYVFHFPYDTLPLFTSYGQLFRSDVVKINPNAIRNKNEWGNLMGGLIQKYPDVEPERMFKTILRTDSLKGRDLKQVSILLHSQLTNEKNFVYPDQYYKGSIGKISGIALIRQSGNRSNAIMLYDYCRKNWWRNKLAEKLGLFPIMPEEKNKSADVLLYQELIKKIGFIKKM